MGNLQEPQSSYHKGGGGKGWLLSLGVLASLLVLTVAVDMIEGLRYDIHITENRERSAKQEEVPNN